MQNNTIMNTGYALVGVGLSQINVDIKVGLSLIGIGVLLQIIVPALNKVGIDAQSFNG